MTFGKDAAWIKPFLTGAVVATSINILLKLSVKPKLSCKGKSKCLESKCSTKPNENNNSSSSSITSQNKRNSQKIIDSPSLDQRLLRKAEAALLKRTSRLIIVVERCTNDHNYSAILRTAEALGVQHVYIIAPQDMQQTLKIDSDVLDNDENLPTSSIIATNDGSSEKDHDRDSNVNINLENIKLHRSSGQQVKKAMQSEIQDRAMHHLFAQRALDWLDVKEFETTSECIKTLRDEGYTIWSTDLSQVAVCLTREALLEDYYNSQSQQFIYTSDEKENSKVNNDYDINVIPDKLAIVFGTEAVGCTAEILNASDKRVYLPLYGFADSLNLSVATALVVHQLFNLDPSLIGAMSNDERMNIRRKWYKKLASQRLLTKGEKQWKRRLEDKIKNCEELEWRCNNPGVNGSPELNEDQLEKVYVKLPAYRSQLQELENSLQEKANKVAEDLVLNPPEPLDDMRRPDEHRSTFISKNLKKSYGDLWSHMPATNYYRTENGENGTSAFFRERLE